MKLIGLRLMLWGGVAFIAVPVLFSLLANFADSLGFLGMIVGMAGQFGFLVVIAGAIVYFIGKQREPASQSQAQLPEISRTKFWIGAFLAAVGFGIPAFFVYNMLFVPGGGDAIFLVMIFGPFGLVGIVGGILMMVRNRK
ncbi:MAG: hypothetical protein KGL77_04005 [Actinomycetales bacterium]|nr:hypothetical protein [Actinomycetales bacterium]